MARFLQNSFARALTGLIVLGLPAAGLATAGPAAADTTTTASTVTMVGDPGSYIDSAPDLWRAGPDTITVSGSADGSGLYVNVKRGAANSLVDYYSMNFAAAPGQQLQSGVTYSDAQRAPFRAAGHPGIDIGGNGRGCNTDTGQFTVLDIAPDLSRLWIVYEEHCEGGTAATYGEIRYNEPADPDLVVAPSEIAFPARGVGNTSTAVPVNVINTGTVPVTVGSVAVTGAAAGDYAATGVGQCATIAVGATCAIDVTFHPRAFGDRAATLTITDSSAAGSHAVALDGTGLPTSTVTMTGDPGAYVSGSGSDLWASGPDQITASGDPAGGSVVVNVSRANGTELGDYYAFDLAAPAGQPLQTGVTYSGAKRSPDATHPGIDIGGNGRGCNTDTGQFTVLDMAPDLSRLWVLYEEHCEGGAPATYGEIRYNEPSDADLVVAAHDLGWPTGTVGTKSTTLPVSLINLSSAPIQVSSAAVSGPAAADFLTAGIGSCATIAAGASCAIDVSFDPTAAGNRQATLTIADSSAEGSHTVALSGSATLPVVVTPPPAPEVPVASLTTTVANGDVVHVSWTNPTDSRWVRTVVREASGTTPPASEAAGSPLYSGTGTSVDTAALPMTASYAFTVFAEYSDGSVLPSSVVVHNTNVTLSVTNSTLTYGGGLTASGRATDASTGAPMVGATVRLLAWDYATNRYALAATVVTGADGSFSVFTRPGRSYGFLALCLPDPTHLGGVSNAAPVTVAPMVGAHANKGKVRHGSAVSIQAAVYPAAPGQTVLLQEYTNGAWHTVAHRSLDANGQATFSVKPKKGTHHYRVLVGGGTVLAAGNSSTVTVRAT